MARGQLPNSFFFDPHHEDAQGEGFLFAVLGVVHRHFGLNQGGVSEDAVSCVGHVDGVIGGGGFEKGGDHFGFILHEGVGMGVSDRGVDEFVERGLVFLYDSGAPLVNGSLHLVFGGGGMEQCGGREQKHSGLEERKNSHGVSLS